MKSKLQKKQEMDKGKDLLEKSKSVIFVDFSKTPTSQINILKNSISDTGG